MISAVAGWSTERESGLVLGGPRPSEENSKTNERTEIDRSTLDRRTCKAMDAMESTDH